MMKTKKDMIMTDPNLVPFCDVFRPKFPPNEFQKFQKSTSVKTWKLRKIPKTAAFGETGGNFCPVHGILITTQPCRLPKKTLLLVFESQNANVELGMFSMISLFNKTKPICFITAMK